MQELIIRDVRLKGGKPKGTEVLEVDEDTPISWPILWTKTKSDFYDGAVYLRIAAHGFETLEKIVDPVEWAMRERNSRNADDCQMIFSQGGSGIQFCKENITLSTLSKFSPLKGLLRGIDLLACGAAYITPGFEDKDGDGNLLCYRLAQITQTWVRASTATQLYYGLPQINFGEWEGTVLTYAPSGAVVKVEHGDGVPASCPVR
jgi:hypothetical protein